MGGGESRKIEIKEKMKEDLCRVGRGEELKCCTVRRWVIQLQLPSPGLAGMAD